MIVAVWLWLCGCALVEEVAGENERLLALHYSINTPCIPCFFTL